MTWSKDIHADDVSQGRLGNCYYLAALACCAAQDNDTLIRDILVEEGEDVGLYGVKFFLNGKWVTTVVDSLIPCTQSWEGGPWNPIFAELSSHEVFKAFEMHCPRPEWSVHFR